MTVFMARTSACHWGQYLNLRVSQYQPIKIPPEFRGDLSQFDSFAPSYESSQDQFPGLAAEDVPLGVADC
ncbi:unnamed protein product [Tuwongella immobilis]|uniref:Uncharacterized protein n=1 Tax=Tuwongella immobilis TaxID=692036 RepID=A0A6C2YVP9_9BACT|nr:unnamed protein product [Tuwongella immobilis]VTS08756.1 unnamed protein product [Tuwongella immobilis]